MGALDPSVFTLTAASADVFLHLYRRSERQLSWVCWTGTAVRSSRGC